MIAQFTVENIFSIREPQTFSFELKKTSKKIKPEKYVEMPDGKRILKTACIFGANASGKTNLLTALDFFYYVAVNSFRFDANELIETYPFRFDGESKDKPSKFSIEFYSNEIRYIFELTIEKGSISHESLSYRRSSQKKTLYERNRNTIRWAREVKGSKKTIEESLRDNCTVLNIGAQLNNERLKDIHQALAKCYMPNSISSSLCNNWEIVNKNEWIRNSIINSFHASGLKEISSINATERGVSEEFARTFNAEMVKKMRESNFKFWDPYMKHNIAGTDYDIDYTYESAGVKRFAELLKPILVDLRDDRLLALDELEHSLHYEIIEFILLTFERSSREAQMVVCTHSLSLLETDVLDDSQMWFASKSDEAVSSYTRASEIKRLRKDVNRLTLYKRNIIEGYVSSNKNYVIELPDIV